MVFDYAVRRLKRIVERLEVDRKKMRGNFTISKDDIIAEPLYILLSYYGHPDAHEYVRRTSFQAYKEKKSLREVIERDDEIMSYLRQFTTEQEENVFDAEKYTGIAAEKTGRVVRYWEGVFKGFVNKKPKSFYYPLRLIAGVCDFN